MKKIKDFLQSIDWRVVGVIAAGLAVMVGLVVWGLSASVPEELNKVAVMAEPTATPEATPEPTATPTATPEPTHLPEGAKECTSAYKVEYALGETPNADGSWHYAVYQYGEELCSIDIADHLNFRFDDGLAVSDEGIVYMLYYSEGIYTMQIVEVPMPEKADHTEYFGIGYAYGDVPFDYGWATVKGESGTEYLICTDNVEALCRNGLENRHLYSELMTPLSSSPIYRVVELLPENANSFELTWGGDFWSFKVVCYFDGPGGYQYELVSIPDVALQYLSIVMPEEEIEAKYGQRLYSYDEARKLVDRMNEELPQWEESHKEEIMKKLEDPDYFWILRDYPEAKAFWEKNK